MIHDFQIHRIRELRKCGYSQRQVAKELGINRRTVRKHWDAGPDAAATPRARKRQRVLEPFAEKIRELYAQHRNCDGDVEKKSFRLYLHYYRNANRTHADREALKTRVMTVRQLLEGGTSIEALSDADKVIAEKYLICTRVGRGGKLRITLNAEALQRAERNFGIFCLVSNKHKDPWVTLKRYRMRNRIEESYRVSKSELDGDRARVWSMRKVRGKELCRMVALGYHFYLQTAINKVRLEAARLAADESLTQQDRKACDGVRKWLEATTLRGLMAWFNCVETVTVQNEFARKRWSTEMIKRDQLFLKMLYSEEVQTFNAKDLEETLPAEDSE